MKKTFFVRIIFLMFSVITLTSSVPVSNETRISDDELVENNYSLSNMRVGDVLKLSVREFKELYGKKLTFKERMAFKMLQKQLKADLKDSKITSDQRIDFNKAFGDQVSNFNVGGFILGFLLGLIGVGLAHIFSSDKGFRRSSWQGFGAWIIVLLVLVLI